MFRNINYYRYLETKTTVTTQACLSTIAISMHISGSPHDADSMCLVLYGGKLWLGETFGEFG